MLDSKKLDIMSRHRNVRSFSADDLRDYDEYEHYKEEEEEFDESQEHYVINRHETGTEEEMTEEQKAQMQSGYEEIRKLIPDGSGVTRGKIEDALWYYYFDVQLALKYLLETATLPPHNRKDQLSGKKAPAAAGESRGQKGCKPKQGGPAKAKGKREHSSPSGSGSSLRPLASTKIGTMSLPSLSSTKLPAPVAAAKKKAEETERQKMIAAAEEEADALERRFDEESVEVLDDVDGEADDTQLVFDISALNMAMSTSNHVQSELPPRPPEQQQESNTLPPRKNVASRSLAAAGSCGSLTSVSTSAGASPKGSPKMSRRVNVEEEYAKRVSEEDNMNLVIIGKPGTVALDLRKLWAVSMI